MKFNVGDKVVAVGKVTKVGIDFSLYADADLTDYSLEYEILFDNKFATVGGGCLYPAEIIDKKQTKGGRQDE